MIQIRETGDTSDGGDNARLRAQEREAADGRLGEPQDLAAVVVPAKAPPKVKGRVRERPVADPARSATTPPPAIDITAVREPTMSRKSPTPKPPAMKRTKTRNMK